MANLNENRIGTTITGTHIDEIKAGFAQINAALSAYTQALIDVERKKLFGAGPKRLALMTDTAKQALLLKSKLPPALQTAVDNLEKDIALINQLQTVMNTELAQLLQRIKDTKRLAVHEAYSGTLALYKVIGEFSDMGIEGFEAAFNILKPNFEVNKGRPRSEDI